MKNQQIVDQLINDSQDRARQSRAERIEVVQRYSEGDYAILADPKKTIRRLYAKGSRQQALRFAELCEHLEEVKADPEKTSVPPWPRFRLVKALPEVRCGNVQLDTPLDCYNMQRFRKTRFSKRW